MPDTRLAEGIVIGGTVDGEENHPQTAAADDDDEMNDKAYSQAWVATEVNENSVSELKDDEKQAPPPAAPSSEKVYCTPMLRVCVSAFHRKNEVEKGER